MALASKKTYSKRENVLPDATERGKENVDPFDALLESPLKQDVQFQPLGFWGKKVRDLESKKKKEFECGLYEASYSDVSNSSWKKSKPRTLQPKSKISKLTNGRKKHFSANSFTENGTEHKVLSNESTTLKSDREIPKYKNCSLKSPKEILNLSCRTHDCFECLNRHSDSRKFFKSSRKLCTTFHSVNCQNSEKIKVKKLDLKIYEDNSPGEQTEGIKDSVIDKCNEDSINKTMYCSDRMEICNKDSSDKTIYCNDIMEICNKDSSNKTMYCNDRMEICNKDSSDKTIYCNDTMEICSKDSSNKTMYCNDTMEETAMFSTGCDKFRFVTKKRYFNIPNFLTCNVCPDSPTTSSEVNNRSSITQSVIEEKEIFSPVTVTMSEDDTLEAESSDSDVTIMNESLEDFAGETDSEESTTILESLGVALSNDSELNYVGNSDLLDNFEESLEQESVDAVAETSSSSDDTFSENETVIKISPEPRIKNPGSEIENDVSQSDLSPKEISLLTTGISDLSLTKVADDGVTELETDGNFQSSNFEGKEEDSFSAEVRNVTKRRGFSNVKNERTHSRVMDRRSGFNVPQVEVVLDQTLENSCIIGRTSLDWNKTAFGNPVFESTRVFDKGPTEGIPQKPSNQLEKMDCSLEETLSGGYALKPGKQWVRSMSVLKQFQNGGVFESTRITGRKFESFVQDLLKMQNEKSNFFTTVADKTAVNRTKNEFFDGLSPDGTVLHCESLGGNESEELDGSLLSKTVAHKTILGKSLFNHTVKVVQPEDVSGSFRSALGLHSKSSFIQECMTDDVISQESPGTSARDFILMQCGQEDVLPFEEYFNEKTLPNCKKIGEGVYGEVFMCSDTVIKIIPIEGSEQVNGSAQKTFEEIISEVVIALKLSKLREGDRNRTDGFSEMKRCWCVKGKYPEYLLKLWNEYDQAGSGSENDSPVMFKDDQLYLILELANGGKDLESFVFSSSLQTLSVFIQAAFSLAAAEKAFEFEHRDLHWGNILISKTNEKVMSVALDGVEYKIPTKGVKVCIIDFTLSRINHEGCCIYNDLSSDPELFMSHGDYQFEIYRMMQKELKNDWSLFNPKTNLFWLHYTIDKMIKMVRYKIRNSKLHTKHMKDLKTLESVILEHKSSMSFVLSKDLSDMLIKL